MKRAIVIVAILFGLSALATPFVLGNVIRLTRFVNQAAFPAASSLNEGGIGYDTEVDIIRYSNGAAWYPIVVDRATLAAVYINGPINGDTVYGGLRLPGRYGFTAQEVGFRIRTPGAGGTTRAVFRIHDGTNNCDAEFECNSAVGNYNVLTRGSCTFPPNASLTFLVTSIGDCMVGPDIIGNLMIYGVYN